MIKIENNLEEILGRILREEEKKLLDNEKVKKLLGDMCSRYNSIKFKFDKAHSKIEEFKDIVFINGLTKISNRKYFDDKIQECVEKANILGTPLSLIMLDINNFKKFNDIYEHQAGDYVLREMCKVISDIIPEENIFARYGGRNSK